MSVGPLSGLRVIEISSFVAAPLGGMTLAQLGADVIRLDPIGGAGDRMRWPLTRSGTSLYWTGLNKSKRSMTVDFRAEAGRELVRELVGSCPPRTCVVLTNAAGQEWLSYDSLRARCTDLIHVQVEGQSDGSPAVDYTVNAEVGFPMVTGPSSHGDPVNHVLPAWDIACGLYAALGTVAAVRRRDHTGEGEFVNIALGDVALAMAGNLGFLAEAQVNNVDRRRIGNYLYGGFARDFLCADGTRVMVVALTARHWRDLLGATGLVGPVRALEEALSVDFFNEDDRFEYREALAGLIQPWFATRTFEQIAEQLRGTSLLWSRYQSFHDVVRRLQGDTRPNSLMSEIDQPGVGRHLAPGSPLRLGGHRQPAEAAPTLGEHTVDLLTSELGHSLTDLERMLADGVIGTSSLGHP